MNNAFVEVRGLTKRYGERAVVFDVGFELEAGAFLSLLGPSGSGKTTVLRMLAGLVQPDSGFIRIDGQDVFTAKKHVPVEERGLGMVFQDYALWPHMSVAQNVAFGLRLHRTPRAEVTERVAAILDLVGLSGMQRRFPYQLSGGQQQRVAMARALAIQPKLLLLDEPLSSLDTGLREAMREELVDIVRRARTTVINVTHDQNEAMLMSDCVLLLRDGQVQQFGAPAELYETPRTAFVGSFVGAANILRGIIMERAGDRVTLQHGEAMLHGRDVAQVAGAIGDPGTLLCRPEAVRINTSAPTELTNTLLGSVARHSFVEGRWRLSVKMATGDDILAYNEHAIVLDTPLWLTLPPEDCLLVASENA